MKVKSSEVIWQLSREGQRLKDPRGLNKICAGSFKNRKFGYNVSQTSIAITCIVEGMYMSSEVSSTEKKYGM
jgi:hypothetical protein